MLFTFHRDTSNGVKINYIYMGLNVETEHFFEDGMIKVCFQVSLFNLYYF
jgi:hypothetical protein